MIPRIFLFGALVASFASAGVVRRSVAEQALVVPSEQDSTTLKSATTHAILYDTISPDGSCGGETGYTCAGSTYGNCCSIYGYCGATSSFCGADCFEKAGLCSIAQVDTTPVVKEEMAQPTTMTTPKPVHTPWKATNPHPPKFKPSYKIDNGERAPNQVWN